MGIVAEPEIPPRVEENWQAMLDILARVCNVPAALIMRIAPEEIEVFAKSSNEGNPYEVGAKEELRGELYCEYVLKTDAELLVPNALKDEEWKDNPDVALSMISYCGLPIHWPNGSHFGTICILDRKENSYTEAFRELLVSFRDAVENSLELIEAIRLKDNILSIAAHDLRSPLAQIEGLVGLVLEQEDKLKAIIDPEVPRLIHNSVTAMRELVEQLLKAQEVESLGNQLRYESFDLSTLLTECFASIERTLEAKEQSLIQQFPGQLNVIGIPIFIKDAIFNLLSNASKYSPAGSEISTFVQSDGENVAIHVIDQGPGFTTEDHEKMFGKFQRLSARPTQDETSSGLGLYIVSCIAEHHGGKVIAQSSPQRGAHMIFSWPAF